MGVLQRMHNAGTAYSIPGGSCRALEATKEGADGQRAAAPQPAATAAVQKAVPRKCGATLREYEALQVEISLGQAIRIVGCKGTELSRVAYGGQESVMVSWAGEEGLFSKMNATFDNDRLVAKSQLGLK